MTSGFRRIVLRLANALRPWRPEADLDRELAAHRALIQDDYVRRGLAADDAALAATRALGGELRVKELHRDARSLRWIDDVRRDVSYAFRMCRRAPGFTAVVVVTLAVGIGANTAIFSVVDAVVLQPLPYPDSERLVHLYENVPASESPNHKAVRTGGVLISEVIALRERSRQLSHVVGYGTSVVTMMGARDAVLLNGAAMSLGAWPMLGVPPLAGRWFTPDEERSNAHVAILSYDAWHKYFDADPDVLRRTVTFASSGTFTGGIVFGTAYSIVGVMPRGFHFPYDATEFWTPLALAPSTDGRPRRTSMIAQIAAGTTPAAARAEVTTILAESRAKPAIRAETAPPRFELARVEDEVSGPVKAALVVLAAAVGFVLLIACANVASLLLARSAARSHEMAVRAALGAGRGRLVRQTLTESLVLAILGGAAGIGFAFGGIALFRELGTSLSRFDLGTAATSFPRLSDISVDHVALFFALFASILTGLVFGLAPALRCSRQSRADALRDATSAAGFGIRRGRAMQSGLVVAEIALAVPLFVGGALLIRSFMNLAAVDPGYDVSHVLTFQIAARGDKYTAAQIKLFADDVVARIRSVPQVTAAGYARQLPMVQLIDSLQLRTSLEPQADGAPPTGGDSRFVSDGYLQAIGARLAAGRWPAGPREIVVNRTLASHAFEHGAALGRIVYMGTSPIPREIVGVVEDQKLLGLDRQAAPQFFADLGAWSGPNLLPLGPYYAVRTRGDPGTAIASIRTIVSEIDREAPIYNVATLEQIVANSVTVPRMYAVLVGIFAAVAVALAAIGIYGVMAYSVAQRTREIGIRMALGAPRGGVVALVLWQGGVLTLAGLVLGTAGAVATTKYLEGLLFGVTPLDPSTFAIVTAAFASVATAAAYAPARRAARVDPAVALRRE
jgi:putative ABC transport system permease protein